MGRGYELLLCEAGHLNTAMSKCGKSAVITKLESCHSYCANFKKNLVFCCFSLYLHDLKLSNDPKFRLFHSVHGTPVFKWPGTQGGQVPDYVQYPAISPCFSFLSMNHLALARSPMFIFLSKTNMAQSVHQ